MVKKSVAHRTERPHGNLGFFASYAFRLVQLVIALVVAGLYGQDLREATRRKEAANSKWVYAEIVAGLTAITAIVYMVPRIRSVMFWIWDVILFILWTALFGVFAKMWLHENCEGIKSCERMRAAMWVDLVGMLLMLISAAVGAYLWRRDRHGRSTYTGRSAVV